MITGAFSVTHQAIQLGFVPRLSIRHTSVTEAGQIYIPFVNWALMVAVMVLVLTFKSSTNLAAAYGIAVTGAMLIDTCLDCGAGGAGMALEQVDMDSGWSAPS